MVHPRQDELIASLPTEVASDLRAALAHPLLYEPEPSRLLTKVMSAIAWPDYRAPLPLASDLAPPQRTVAEVLAHHPSAWLPGLPGPAWNRRRWLGLDPPSVLERETTLAGVTKPLWRHVREADGPNGVSAVLATLDTATRVEAYCWLTLGAYRSPVPIAWVDWGAPDAIRAEDCGWAHDLAAFVVDIYEANHPWSDGLMRGNRGNGEAGAVIPREIKLPLYLSLVRSGRPIDARFDVLIPLTGTPIHREVDRAVECLAAVPEPRRTGAILAAFSRGLPSDAIYASIALLPHFPSAEVVRAILTAMRGPGGLPEKLVLKQLAPFAKEHPAIAAEIKAHKASLKEGLGLKCVEVLEPKDAGELDAVQREQVIATGQELDGQLLSPEERLAGTGEEPAFYELRILRIADKQGVVRYEAFLPDLDSGSVFEVGTTKSVGGRSQGGVECADPDLRAALEAIFYDARGKGPKTKAAGRKATSTAAKKKATKKR